MTVILIALIALTSLSVWASRREWDWFSDIVSPIFAAVGLSGLAAYPLLVFFYLAAEHKAEILNREYGTNYTQEEVFYAHGVIDTIRQLDRTRVEINGNLITGE